MKTTLLCIALVGIAAIPFALHTCGERLRAHIAHKAHVAASTNVLWFPPGYGATMLNDSNFVFGVRHDGAVVVKRRHAP